MNEPQNITYSLTPTTINFTKEGSPPKTISYVDGWSFTGLWRFLFNPNQYTSLEVNEAGGNRKWVIVNTKDLASIGKVDQIRALLLSHSQISSFSTAASSTPPHSFDKDSPVSPTDSAIEKIHREFVSNKANLSNRNVSLDETIASSLDALTIRIPAEEERLLKLRAGMAVETLRSSEENSIATYINAVDGDFDKTLLIKKEGANFFFEYIPKMKLQDEACVYKGPNLWAKVYLAIGDGETLDLSSPSCKKLGKITPLIDYQSRQVVGFVKDVEKNFGTFTESADFEDRFNAANPDYRRS